jgi:predicted metal-dependent peptidase
MTSKSKINDPTLLEKIKGEPTAAEKSQAEQAIIVARIAMLMHTPFWGNIASRLRLVSDVDWCPTAATDGRTLWYNSKFVNMLKPREVIFLIGHEILHAVYEHVGKSGRCGGRNAQLWNIAADYAVNRDLIEFKIGERITTFPCLFDPQFKDMSAEEIYEKLMEDAEKISIDSLLSQVLDEHLESDAGNDTEGDGEDPNGKPRLSEKELSEIRDELRDAIMSSVQAHGVGNVPLGVRRLIKDLTEPKMNWKELLVQQIESQIKNDFTYMRPNRRGWLCDAVLPSMQREPTVEADIFLDASGSIGPDEMKVFMSEVVGIMQQHASFKINVASFDTQVYNRQTFTEENVHEIYDYEIKGDGGTDFNCIWEFLKGEEIVPKQLVCFTDMECSTWGDPDYAPTLWLAYKTNVVAPHGTTVKFE